MNVRDVAVRLSNGGPVKHAGQGWMVRCPAHDDDTPSLSIAPGASASVVLHCHAGCRSEDVLAAAELTWADLDEAPAKVEAEVTYDYTDDEGRLLYQVVRRPGKKFLQRRPDRIAGTWIWNLSGIERVLYRLPEVKSAVADGRPVWITEGEKDADYVRGAGQCATTCPQGAGKWDDSFAVVLEGADVTVWADRDEAGWKHAHQVRQSLIDHRVASVRIVESAHGKDAADHLSHGLGLDDVLVTVPAVGEEPPTLFLRADEFIDQDQEVKPWALTGLMRRGGERLIITGYEGFGKSSLLKQIAVCAAVGLHPFLLEQMGEPKRVVFIDCENPAEDLREDFHRLREVAKSEGKWDDPDLFIQANPPLNLGDLPDAMWLAERVRAHAPDLLLIGPLYNLMNGDSSKEVEVARMLRTIGRVQTEMDCAVVIEHHVPHLTVGEERTIRPIGSTILQRWTSFGFGLMPTNQEDPMSSPFEFRPWRGVRRRGRSWPSLVSQTGSQDKGWYWKQDHAAEAGI
jgi:hypothetical protein